jgi:hypothetical protein
MKSLVLAWMLSARAILWCKHSLARAQIPMLMLLVHCLEQALAPRLLLPSPVLVLHSYARGRVPAVAMCLVVIVFRDLLRLWLMTSVSHWNMLIPQRHLILLSPILCWFLLRSRDQKLLDLLLQRLLLYRLHRPDPTTFRYGFFTAYGEPHSHQEALCDWRWKSMMDLEYGALMKNNT